MGNDINFGNIIAVVKIHLDPIRPDATGRVIPTAAAGPIRDGPVAVDYSAGRIKTVVS